MCIQTRNTKQLEGAMQWSTREKNYKTVSEQKNNNAKTKRRPKAPQELTKVLSLLLDNTPETSLRRLQQ